ncbi:MaoC family dehydratase N-terminal domain-containing protein [Nocardioides carbamazepini]|uniref:MaoC/PaaZ C-terminal domain-containing protein n=1 Tax=Nocardioides carbamazepini TaxID=2854259 RepID=UPI002149CE5E|nr:MaoC/PaaZ C-terminal domain-containing protein [Nocardioides carbamazepini]MCR1785637.1 MaoC family dehydratase N-terminal domain-containing protein [Nocardioides carbamazepini]
MKHPMEWAFDDFKVGQVFDSQRRTVTEADVMMFASWSWDTNPVHTDAVGQAHARFGGPIAHGLLGMSIAMGLVSRIGVFEGCSVALLGVDEWRFVAPIRSGDTLGASVEILATRKSSSGQTGILQRWFTLVNQHEDVVQQGRIDLMVNARTADQPAPT